MPRAAKVEITKDTLEQVLGLKWYDMTIIYAQVDHSNWNAECLELIVSGDGLPEEFEVVSGAKIKSGVITVQTKVIETEIKPI